MSSYKRARFEGMHLGNWKMVLHGSLGSILYFDSYSEIVDFGVNRGEVYKCHRSPKTKRVHYIPLDVVKDIGEEWLFSE